MNDTTVISERIAALQAELKSVQETARKDADKRRKDFVKQWQFTIAPGDRHWDKIYDETIKRYYLSGKILNADEYKAVGGDPTKGGMSYLYNTVTKRIVMREGGGSIYIPDECSNTADVYAAIAEFISNNPDGGDVTTVIVSNPNFRW